MFKTIAGKTVELITLGGIRNLLFNSPLGQNKLYFSTAPRQETICVPDLVYAGKKKNIATINKKVPFNNPQLNVNPIDFEKIA